jgi:hypothetical protein
MYPQYEVDPSVGGRMYYDEMAAKTIGQGSDDGSSDYDFENRYYYWIDKKVTPEQARANAAEEMKHKNLYNNSGSDNKLGVIQGYYGKKGGTLKKGGYVYADILYPFIL